MGTSDHRPADGQLTLEDPDVKLLPEPRQTQVRTLLGLHFEKQRRRNGARASPHEVLGSDVFPLFGRTPGTFAWKEYEYKLIPSWAILRFWVPPEKRQARGREG